MKKILYYNWVDYEDAQRRGGGVSVYQANVLSHLSEKNKYDLYFLCSGVSYDAFGGKPRWEKIKHGPSSDKAKKFEIVNSGVLAPGHHSFGDPGQLEEDSTKEAFFEFIRAHGPFDVIHFNNMEGLPASVLDAKKEFQKTKFILSLHNYYPVCPQVNLWHKEAENCLDYKDGWKCEDCLPFRHEKRVVKTANALAYSLKKKKIIPGSRLYDGIFSLAFKLKPYIGKLLSIKQSFSDRKGLVLPDGGEMIPVTEIKPDHEHFKERRERFCQYINSNCDAVLAVSHRVKEVASKFGIDEDIISVSYIGTKHADVFENTTENPSIVKSGGELRLAYLGYMRRDKGYYFLVDALLDMPDDMAGKISVVLAAKNSDPESLKKLKDASYRFNGIFHYDGYSHSQLDDILSDVDIGVVPVLWEDNLPQVAIEMHSRHIPLITSDLGGAQEIVGKDDFVFRNDDKEDFYRALRNIMNRDVGQADYWPTAMTPVSMVSHIKELEEFYV